jgi:hypothetical protein
MSMLDLLFGLFGVMIVLAAVIGQQRRAEPRVVRTPFVEVSVVLEGGGLAATFVDFFLEAPDGSRLIFSPLTPRTDPEGILYMIDMADAGSTASLRLDERHVRPGARLYASVQNIVRLAGTTPGQAAVDVVLIVRTEQGSCPVRRRFDAADLAARDQADATRRLAPSVFDLLRDGARLCDGTGEGLSTTVRDGWLELSDATG